MSIKGFIQLSKIDRYGVVEFHLTLNVDYVIGVAESDRRNYNGSRNAIVKVEGNDAVEVFEPYHQVVRMIEEARA